MAEKLLRARSLTCDVEDTDMPGVYRFAGRLYVDNTAPEQATEGLAPEWLTTGGNVVATPPTPAKPPEEGEATGEIGLARALTRGRRPAGVTTERADQRDEDIVSQAADLSDAIDDAFAPGVIDSGGEVQVGNYRPATALVVGEEARLYPSQLEAQILSMNGFDLDNPSAPAAPAAPA
ncbi:hypothetical protein FE249_18050 (plasmid) [Acidiphilium multivorum]|uniref:hypothetical protein n=1 Tax=Acidiphilium TaxID=522 RepID=UPI00157A3C24|nr:MULTISPECIES: hypothetical protein [Acidiphilium]UNC16160.1 hypothetical protein FE249_18050 [Acidiphilium multivorum]